MAVSSHDDNIEELLDRAEHLAPGDFDAFFANMLSIHARRKANSISADEYEILQKINREFPAARLNRFYELDESRKQGALSAVEHRELLKLVKQLEKFDAQRLEWVGQLAILRNVPFAQQMEDLGLIKKSDGQ